MADLEIFRMNEDGAGWVSFDEITNDEKLDLELGVMLDDVKMLCVTCLAFIPKGSGFYCETHKENK